MGTPLDAIDGTWNALTPEPTSLVALWPHDEAPGLAAVVAALAAHVEGPVTIIEELPADEAEVPWSAAVALPGAPSPVVIWTERAQPMSDEELRRLEIEPCARALGVQCQLDGADPLTGYHRILRVVAGAWPDVSAILDVNTTQWLVRADLDAMSGARGIEPAAEILWTTQVVEGRGRAEPVVWLHTHGLWRCGRPELEMLEVPSQWTLPAVELLNDVAGLLLERGVPVAGARFEIGPGLSLTLQPWQEVAPFVTGGAPGGPPDRVGEGADAHTGPRAVICANEAIGAYRKVWVWPRAEVERRGGDEAAVYVTTRATERQAALARAAWSQFVDAFGAARPDTRFGVKAGFSQPASADREHLWFEVCRAEIGRVEGRLVHEPRGVKDLREGDRTWIELDQVSDWRVVTPRRSFGPDEAGALREVIVGGGAS